MPFGIRAIISCKTRAVVSTLKNCFLEPLLNDCATSYFILEPFEKDMDTLESVNIQRYSIKADGWGASGERGGDFKARNRDFSGCALPTYWPRLTNSKGKTEFMEGSGARRAG